jgi:hypothetical protein
MNDRVPEFNDSDPSPKTYVLTGQGLTLQQDPPEFVPTAEKNNSWGSPLLWTSLMLALSAYYLDAGKWAKAVEASIDRRQQSVACAPYRAWVAQHPLSYEEVSASASAWAGKPVLWEISRGPDGSSYYAQDTTKGISWTNPAACEKSGPIQRGPPVMVLALVESNESSTPLLIFLEADK